jgi:hypothetical protein
MTMTYVTRSKAWPTLHYDPKSAGFDDINIETNEGNYPGNAGLLMVFKELGGKSAIQLQAFTDASDTLKAFAPTFDVIAKIAEAGPITVDQVEIILRQAGIEPNPEYMKERR